MTAIVKGSVKKGIIADGKSAGTQEGSGPDGVRFYRKVAFDECFSSNRDEGRVMEAGEVAH